MAGKGLLEQMFPPGVQAAKKPPVERIPIDSAIVIGAGIAGLTAAYLLTKNGIVNTVTVLESCHRPGGRIQTKTYPNGQHGTVGFMEYYEPAMDEDTWWLLNELGFGQKDMARWPMRQYYWWRDQYVYQDGNWDQFIHALPFDDEAGADDFVLSEDEIWDLEKSVCVWPLDTGGYPDYDDNEFEDWMLWARNKKGKVNPHWRSDVVELWDINLRSETGCQSWRSSAAWGIMCSCYWDLGKSFWTLKDGNYAMIEALMQNIPAGSVHLHEAATSVTNVGDTGVQVETGVGTYNADVAIVATPHNKVTSIVPELSSERVAIYDSMGNTKNYVALQQYTERFWETIYGLVDSWGGYSDQGINHTTRTSALSIGDETGWQTGSTGILSHYVNDPTASEYWVDTGSLHARGAEKDAITNFVLDDMEQYFPVVRDYLIPGSERVYKWDPYGPNYPPGHVLNGGYATNKTPVGRIYFVGDYIEDFGVGDAIASSIDVTDKFE